MMSRILESSREKVQTDVDYKTYEKDSDILKLMSLIIAVHLCYGIKDRTNVLYKLKNNFTYLRHEENEPLCMFKQRYEASEIAMNMYGETKITESYTMVSSMEKLNKRQYDEAFSAFDYKYKNFETFANMYHWLSEFKVCRYTTLPEDNTANVLFQQRQHAAVTGNRNKRNNNRRNNNGSCVPCTVFFQPDGEDGHSWQIAYTPTQSRRNYRQHNVKLFRDRRCSNEGVGGVLRMILRYIKATVT